MDKQKTLVNIIRTTVFSEKNMLISQPDLHLGYALQASSFRRRESAGANVVSQEGTLLQTQNVP